MDAPRPDDSIWTDPENPPESRQGSVVSVILDICNWVCRAFMRIYYLCVCDVIVWKDLVPEWMSLDLMTRFGRILRIRPNRGKVV